MTLPLIFTLTYICRGTVVFGVFDGMGSCRLINGLAVSHQGRFFLLWQGRSGFQVICQSLFFYIVFKKSNAERSP